MANINASPESDVDVDDEETARVAILNNAFDLSYRLKTKGSLRDILERAREDAGDAVTALVNANPFDAAGVRELQWKVQRFNSLWEYIKEILEEGRSAQSDMNDEESAALEKLLRPSDGELRDD